MHRWFRVVQQRVALAIAGLVLVGCAAKPTTQVMLLPQADGSRSAVKVQTDANSQTLAEPFQWMQVRQGGTPIVDTATAAYAHKQFAPLFDAAPPPPSRSVLFFQTGGTALTAESQLRLSQTLEEALRRSGAELVVTGHTDTKGSSHPTTPSRCGVHNKCGISTSNEVFPRPALTPWAGASANWPCPRQMKPTKHRTAVW